MSCMKTPMRCAHSGGVVPSLSFTVLQIEHTRVIWYSINKAELNWILIKLVLFAVMDGLGVLRFCWQPLKFTQRSFTQECETHPHSCLNTKHSFLFNTIILALISRPVNTYEHVWMEARDSPYILCMSLDCGKEPMQTPPRKAPARDGWQQILWVWMTMSYYHHWWITNNSPYRYSKVERHSSAIPRGV